MEPQLTDKDLKEMIKNPKLKVLNIPFDTVTSEGDNFVFTIDKKNFCRDS